jgi:hypothetical protein
MSLDVDIEGEDLKAVPLTQGERLEVHFYLNQSLYLPLQMQLVRITEARGVRQVGAQFADEKSAGYQAFIAFLKMLELLDAAAVQK